MNRFSDRFAFVACHLGVWTVLRADCLLLLLVVSAVLDSALVAAAEDAQAPWRLRIEEPHPWRPPFGLDRVGRALVIVVEIDAIPRPLSRFELLALADGREMSRHPLRPAGDPPYQERIEFTKWPKEIVLTASSAPGGVAEEVARITVPIPDFEADAVAEPGTMAHPIDLGTILVPDGWLLLGGDGLATLRVAALGRARDLPDAEAEFWFASNPKAKRTVKVPLVRNERRELSAPTPPRGAGARDILHLKITDGHGLPLWHKEIPTMAVAAPPIWPPFAATETKLRYDAPISVRAEDGTWSSLSYEEGWNPRFQDVVVSLPNGARFVFWRGAGYAPFWAGRHNTALCYEWAETDPPPDGYTDCVEPLMDKELRYSRVEIVESTSARVHVRWSYQACDFHYKVWGDSVVEDFYFYPDGYGTRALTLKSTPDADYELSEFIILTSQGTYPLSVLPENMVDVLFLDGERRGLLFPFLAEDQKEKLAPRDIPAVYRIRLHKDEALAAVCFSPNLTELAPTVFPPFYDQGCLVTPCYWGSHWPLARGKTTGWKIDDRVHLAPAHNSVMSWARKRPKPVTEERVVTEDALGRTKEMDVRTWVWMIGMTGDSDARLLLWARSFAAPAVLEAVGARLDGYAPTRRAHRLAVDAETVTITIKPSGDCVHPVFELIGAPGDLREVILGERRLWPREYAWDGRTFWLGVDVDGPTELRLQFDP